ncbi:hypothetical protein [Paracoccus rhizosphaerae]|uniref:Uncharacterized protein n=1 Tax=Paracoccus rhizosphaerae TaxID=1133347 RepID=A0ABV6CES9_9RHOB|nr:hypothetical protein [Paracoccus rhizosphaerae]
MARIVDIANGLIGIPRGRFPRTSLIDMPFLTEDAGAATCALWEPFPSIWPMRQAPPFGDREPGLGPVERSKPAADLRCGHAELIRQQFSKTQW